MKVNIRGAIVNAYSGALERIRALEEEFGVVHGEDGDPREHSLRYFDDDDGRPMTEAQALNELLDTLSKGVETIG